MTIEYCRQPPDQPLLTAAGALENVFKSAENYPVVQAVSMMGIIDQLNFRHNADKRMSWAFYPEGVARPLLGALMRLIVNR